MIHLIRYFFARQMLIFFLHFLCTQKISYLIFVWSNYFSLYHSRFCSVLCVSGNTALLTNNERQSYGFSLFFQQFSCAPFLIPVNVCNNWDTKTLNPQIQDWVVLRTGFDVLTKILHPVACHHTSELSSFIHNGI